MHEQKLTGEGLCQAGALLEHVARAGANQGYGRDIAAWQRPAIEMAVAETRLFEARCRESKSGREPAVA